MKKKVILITGYDRCGKDYVAEKLKEVFNAKVIHLADGLKDICSDILGIDKNILDGLKNKRGLVEIETSAPLATSKIYPITYEVRKFIIKVADSLRARIGKKVFIKMTLDKVYDSKEEVIIIPDVRFMIEELEIAREIVKTKGKVVTLKVTGDLPDCGKNNEKYEVDDLAVDLVFKNTTDEKGFNNLFNCIVDKITSRLNIPNPIKSNENGSKV